MKKLLSVLLALLLVAALPLGALAEDVDPIAGAVELTVPEEEETALEGDDAPVGYADFVGDTAVSAASGIPLDQSNFPDAVFRKYLKDELDKDNDDTLTAEETEFFSSIDVDGLNITSLEGIAHLPDLTWLTFSDTQVAEVDFSGCPKLYYINCDNTPLTRLDVSGLVELSGVSCDCPSLTSLDATGCKALERLSLMNSPKLAEVKVGGCAKLEELYCTDCVLKSLDVSGCPALTEINVGTTDLTSLDLSKNTKLKNAYINYNSGLVSLKLGKLPALKSLECYDNALTELDVSGCAALDDLFCAENYVLKSLNVSGCPALTELRCYSNSLESIDVSKNPKLQKLYCYSNKLTGIDISANPKLEYLVCQDNAIASIDLSKCPKLVEHAQSKPETELGVRYYETDEYGWCYLVIDETTKLASTGGASIAKAKVSVKNKTYTGKALTPAPTVKLNGVKLVKGTDYTVKYSANKNTGKVTVTITGKGKYEGTAKGSFIIKPKKVSGLKLKAGEKKLTVSWAKAPGKVTGYQIQYGIKKSFAGAKNKTISKAATVKTTFKSLKANKKYYVRIRAYKTVGGTKYYSAWSAAKSVKTK